MATVGLAPPSLPHFRQASDRLLTPFLSRSNPELDVRSRNRPVSLPSPARILKRSTAMGSIGYTCFWTDKQDPNQIATALGVSRATLYRHLALADEAEQAA